MGTLARGLAVWIAGFGIAGCTTLPELGRCGNEIVEPGEACDGLVEGATCGAAGTAAACRFVCADTACPPGHGCGADGVCRAPSGELAPRGPVALDGIRLRLTDLDGDGALDAIAQRGGIGVRYGDLAGGFEDDGPLLGFPFVAPFDLGDLDGDGRDDLACATDIGVVGFLGDRERSLPALPVAPADSSAIALEVSTVRAAAIRYDEFLPLQTALLVADSVGMCLAQNCGVPAARTALPPGRSVDDLRSIAVADVGGLFAEEVALAFIGDDRVFVYRVGTVTVGPDTFGRLELRETIAVPGSIASEAKFADLVGDGGLDLAVAIDTGAGGERVVVAPNNGAAFGVAAIDTVFDTIVTNVCSSRPWPLVIAKINDDNLADFVGDLGVCSRIALNTTLPIAFAPFGSPWDRAATGDVDGDGRIDVIGATGGGRIDVALQSGTGLFPFAIRSTAVDGELRRLRTGDFDGSGTVDIAVLVHTPRDEHISVLFGDPGGEVGAPAVMFRFPAFDDIVALDLFYPLQSSLDSASDLLLAGRRMPGDTAVIGSSLLGHGSRHMYAPFPLPSQTGELGLFAAAVLPGRFTATTTSLDVLAAGVTTVGLGGTGDIERRNSTLLPNAGGLLTGSGLASFEPAWNTPGSVFPIGCAQAVRLREPDGDVAALVTGAGDANTAFCSREPAPGAPRVVVVDPSATAATAPIALPGSPSGRQTLAADDLDGDGHDDLIAGFAGGAGALVAIPGAAGGLDAGAATTTAIPVQAVAILADPGGAIVVIRTTTGLELRRWPALDVVERSIDLPPATESALAVGDIDRDGLADIAVVEAGLLRWFVQVPDDYTAL